MIHLRFEGVPSEADLTLGPAPWFRVAGNFVRQGPDGDITALSLLGSARAALHQVFLRRAVHG